MDYRKYFLNYLFVLFQYQIYCHLSRPFTLVALPIMLHVIPIYHFKEGAHLADYHCQIVRLTKELLSAVDKGLAGKMNYRRCFDFALHCS